MKKMILIVFVILLKGLVVVASEQGKPFMTFYTSVQMGGHYQNWAVIQDNRGVMYIGNGYGVLEFDGSKWRLISLPNSSFASSFAKDSTGRIYVGSAAEIGYLAPDRNGVMQYVSLLQQLPPSDRNFTYVMRVVATPEGIFFQTAEKLFRFRWNPSATSGKGTWQVKTWSPDKSENYFMFIAYIDGKLYVQQNLRELVRLTGNSLKTFTGGELFLGSRVRFMLPFPGRTGNLLVAIREKGLLLFDGNTLKPFQTDADWLVKEGVVDGRVLPDGNIGFISLENGFMVLSPTGKLLLHLNKASGMISQVVRSLCIDKQNNIWLAMDGGIGILEYDSDISFFPLQGSGIIDIVKLRGSMFACSVNGIYVMDSADMQFRLLKGAPTSQYSFFCPVNDKLYGMTLNKIYLVTNTGATPVFEDPAFTLTFTYLLPINTDKSRFLLGTMNGIYLLKKDPAQKNHFKLDGKINGINETVSKITESSPGTWWISTYDAGAIRLHFENNDYNRPVIEHFGPAQGLPLATTVVDNTPRGLVFSTNKGFMKFNEKLRRFENDLFFKDLKMGVYTCESVVVADRQGNIWANGGNETALYKLNPDGSCSVEKGLFARFGEQLVNVIYPDDKGTTWFGYTDGIALYKPSFTQKTPATWSAMIRSVRLANDSTFCPGIGGTARAGFEELSIPYYHNALYFEYSGLSYFKPDANKFSVKLEGFDKDWSAWSPDSKRNYTNLSPGRYNFRVKARNIFGQESTEASLAFTVLRPWYATWWAYLLYALAGILVIYVVVRLRTRKLQERSEALEKIVEQRTSQIQEQKNNVEQLSRIGRDITSSLSIENIIHTVYENVNTLMDASVFTIGLHKPEEGLLEFPTAIEKNQTLASFSVPLTDENRLGAWCFNHRQEVIINDYALDYSKYIVEMAGPIAGENPESVLYLPLWYKDKVIGVITAQSFNKNAYTDYHVNMLRNLATYCAIALENADAYRRLAALLDELKATQSQLIQSEKMASLGELTAGIAHEIKNPLNFVNNFSEINSELIDELQQEVAKGNLQGVEALAKMIQENEQKINHNGKRADSIVKGMLQHSRSSSGTKELTDINALADEYLRLSYHGLRAKDYSFNAAMKTDFDPSLEKVNIVPQEIGRVILNLLTNAFYAVTEKKKLKINGYEPTVTISTRKEGNKVVIDVKDNGNGIPQRVLDKIFQPFFTTKPTGEGTGLGLSISYDIITKGHGGEIMVESREGEGSVFSIHLPV